MLVNSERIVKLSKAPLQEVIFEARWELDIDSQTKQSYDPGFEFAIGVFEEKVREQYPIHKRLLPLGFPTLFPQPQPVHQFWSGEGQWPVLQLGPGIFTANETEKNYVWESEFQPVIDFGLDALVKSYKEEPPFSTVSLRYIDAVELQDEFKDDFINFIEAKLQVQVVKGFKVEGKISQQAVSQVYKLDDGSELFLTISNGEKNGKPGIVWQTAVVKPKRASVEEIKRWIPHAHSITSGLFKQMLKKEFYDSLK